MVDSWQFTLYNLPGVNLLSYLTLHQLLIDFHYLVRSNYVIRFVLVRLHFKLNLDLHDLSGFGVTHVGILGIYWRPRTHLVILRRLLLGALSWKWLHEPLVLEGRAALKLLSHVAVLLSHVERHGSCRVVLHCVAARRRELFEFHSLL